MENFFELKQSLGRSPMQYIAVFCRAPIYFQRSTPSRTDQSTKLLPIN